MRVDEFQVQKVVFLAKGLVDFDEFLLLFFFVIPLVVHMMCDLGNDFLVVRAPFLEPFYSCVCCHGCEA